MAVAPLPVPPGVVRAARIGEFQQLSPTPARWCLNELSGRLTEISGLGDSASLTLAFSIVLEAQHQGEPVAWITRTESCFFPLDAWASGVDLEALAVIRLPDDQAIVSSTDRLARSGGFGLVVFDLGAGGDKATALGRTRPPTVPAAMQARLRAVAHRHDMAIVCLTRKSPRHSSLGSLVSLRVEAHRRRDREGRFECNLQAIRDKQRRPGWSHSEVFRGPDGLQ